MHVGAAAQDSHGQGGPFRAGFTYVRVKSALGEATHRHYVLVRDEHGVLGVWEAEDPRFATRLRVQLELSYPDCTVVSCEAPNFESLQKERPAELAGVGLEPSRRLSFG